MEPCRKCGCELSADNKILDEYLCKACHNKRCKESIARHRDRKLALQKESLLLGAVLKCSRCGVSKACSEFYPHVGTQSGFHTWCKVCSNEHTKTRYHSGGFARARANRVKACFDMTEADLQEFLKDKTTCEICREDLVPSSRNKQLGHIDHDHKTGKIRGLLCQNCNLMLGHARDSVELLGKAAEYLKLHSET